MGIISGTGVFLGLIATLTLYPALIALGLGESRRPPRALPGTPSQIRLPSFPIRYRARLRRRRRRDGRLLRRSPWVARSTPTR